MQGHVIDKARGRAADYRRGRRLLLGVVVCLSVAVDPHDASAAGPKALDASYFFGSCDSCIQNKVTIAGQSFRGTEIILQVHGSYQASISFNARKLPGYSAVTFLLGCNDQSDVGAHAVLQALGDGQAPLGKYTVTQGQPARQAIVPFKGHGSISFVTQGPGNYQTCNVTLVNPLAIVLAGPGSAPLTVAPASVAAGAQETVSAEAPAGTQGTVVVTYASGQQQVVGPTRAGSTGRLTVTFAVPQGVTGTANVTVVTAAKVLQSSFKVTS